MCQGRSRMWHVSLAWFYANAHKITSVYASLDTHLPFQIFYSSWWKNPQTGEHPQPFTVITVDDVTNMRWVPIIPAELVAALCAAVAAKGQEGFDDLAVSYDGGNVGAYAGSSH